MLSCRPYQLDFNVERYTNLATQASVIAGFSFESLVELEVPEGTAWWLAGLYFIFGSMAMALALYCLVVASFACVFGHRLALQGPHGSLEIAVSILIAHRQHIFSVGGLSLFCLVIAAVLMSWIKMGAAAGVVTLIFLLFAAATFHRMVHMAHVFEIKDIDLVTGAVRIADPSSRGAGVDLARLNPGSRKVTLALTRTLTLTLALALALALTRALTLTLTLTRRPCSAPSAWLGLGLGLGLTLTQTKP